MRGSLRQLSQSSSQASYPLLQMKNRLVSPWVPSEDASPSDQADSTQAAEFDPNGASGDEASIGSAAPDEIEPVISASELVLANSALNRGTIGFVLDGQVISLQPGQARRFPAGQRTLQFHRGGQFGAARQVVSYGIYGFEATSEGWKLTSLERLPSNIELIDER